MLGKPEDWTLSGEGAANVVFTYTGDEPDLIGKVLRIKKPKKAVALLDPVHANLDQRIWSAYPGLDSADPVQREFAYIKMVIEPLLGRQFITEQVAVTLATAFTNELQKSWQRYEAWYCDANEPEARPLRASLQPNQTLLPPDLHLGDGPVLCVELKPKCGFLPTAPTVAPTHRRMKYKQSRYALQQRLKLQQGSITRVSDYDPLQLFSGDPTRMRAAVAALLTDPQNNLRLFRDGRPLPYSGEPSELAVALDGLLVTDADHASDGLEEVLVHVLMRTGVLEAILAAQRLDVHDIEGIHHLYQAVMAENQQVTDHLSDAPQLQQARTADGSKSMVSEATSRACQADDRRSAAADAAADAEHRSALSSLTALPEADQLAALRDYLIAATAKDCSIMIALQASRAAHLVAHSDLRTSDGPVPQDTGASRATGHLCTPDGSLIAFKVAVVDLDIKSSAKITHHHALDRSILQCAAWS